MATLRIYSDIVDKDTAQMMQFFGDSDAVTFSGVDDFINSLAEDDGEINLRINCRGGMVDEAWTIYDSLRATGKAITAEVIGEASSSATILLCAAKKGSRAAHPNAKFLFHYPFVPGICQPSRADDLDNIARDLREEERRLLDLYVERTGCDREEMDALMREDRMVGAEEAKRLGFIDTILEPKSAARNTNNTIHKMSIKDAFAALGVALGLTEGTPAVCMEIETAEGEYLRIRKESGEIAVGDEVDSPDGEYLLPDGRKVIVNEGKITEILPPAEDKAEDVGGDPLVGDLEAEVERLHREIEERDERIAELEAALEEARNNEPTEDERMAINAVNAVGGVEQLKTMCSAWHVDKRDFAAKENKAPMTYREYYEHKHKNK